MEALSQRHLRGFYPTLEIVAARLVRRWEKTAGTVLDLAEELKRFTVDVTTQLVFGHDLDTLGKEDDDEDAIQRHLEVFFPAFQRRLNAVVPYWRWVRLPYDRRVDRAIAKIRAWIGKRVEAARARLASDPERVDAPTNFLEAMLVARDSEGRPFSDDVIFGNALTMLLAGEDTTAYTLAWAVHHLCDDARATEALRSEAARVLGDLRVPRDLEQAALLPYAAAVANESMRLRPVAPTHFYEPLRDVVVGDVAVPRGTSIILLTRPPVLDPARFEDPQAFVPERWIPGAQKGAHDAAAHIPFGSGPRICPGRSLALLEMRVVLASLYRSFAVERVGAAADVKEVTAFTMMPVGLRVLLACGGEAPPPATPAIAATHAAPAEDTPAGRCLATAGAARQRKADEPAKIVAKHVLVKYAGAKKARPNILRTREEACLRALEAREKLAAGMSFADVVSLYSDEPGATTREGSLGTTERAHVVPAFADAAFELKAGEVSHVVETDFGFHVIMRTE
jgi:cytochrome P450